MVKPGFKPRKSDSKAMLLTTMSTASQAMPEQKGLRENTVAWNSHSGEVLIVATIIPALI